MATTTKLVELFNADETIAALSTQAFVEAAYENLLGLSGDFSNKDARVAYWVAKIDAGLATADFAATFLAAAAVQGDLLTDAEFAVNTATLVAVAALDETDLTLAAVKAAAVAAVEESEAETPDANAGETFTLTTGADTLTGTDKNDTFTAAVLTANDGDSLDGGAGTDTLNLETATSITDKFVTTGIETVNLNALGALTVDTKSMTGVTTLNSNDAAGAVTVNNIASADLVVGVKGSATNSVDLNYASSALSGSADKLSVSLNGSTATTITADTGFESVDVKTTAASTLATLTASGATALTLSGDAALTVNDNTIDSFTDYTISNTAKVTLGKVGTVKNVDASANTGGVVGKTISTAADLTNGHTTDELTMHTAGGLVKGGAGDDNIALNSGSVFSTNSTIVKLGAGNDKLSLEAVSASGEYIYGEDGDDTIYVGAALTSSDLIDGGAGTDTVNFSAASHSLIAKGVEKVGVNGATTVAFVSTDTATQIADGGADAVTFSNLLNGSTYTSTTAKTGGVTLGLKTSEAGTLNVNLTKGSSDAVTLTNVADATVTLGAASALDGITVDAAATKLTVAATGALTVGTGNHIAASSTEKLQTIAVTGDKGVALGNVTNLDALTSFSLSSTGGAVSVGDLDNSAYTTADQTLTSISATSSAGAATIGNIDFSGLNTTNTGSISEITATGSGGTAATTSIAGATAMNAGDDVIVADKIGSITATSSNSNAYIAYDGTDSGDIVVGKDTATSDYTDGTVTSIKASGFLAAAVGNVKADSIGSIVVESTDTTTGGAVTLGAITDANDTGKATVGTIDLSSKKSTATLGAITADALGNVTVTSADDATLGAITVTNSSNSSVTGNLTVTTTGTTAGQDVTFNGDISVETGGNLTAKSTAGAIAFASGVDVLYADTAAKTISLTDATGMTFAGTSILKNAKGDLSATFKSGGAVNGSTGILNVTGGTATTSVTDIDVVADFSAVTGAVGHTAVTNVLVTNEGTDSGSSTIVKGGAAANTLTIDGATATSSQTIAYYGQTAVDTVTLTGKYATSTIYAEGGADVIVGGDGADTIYAGEGTDTITGGLGADTISLSETTAAIDTVVITGGLTADTISGFTTGAGGDKVQVDISEFEAAGATVATKTLNLSLLDADTDITAAAVTIQEVADQAGGAAVAAATGATLFVLLGETYANVAAVETGLETGDHELTVHTDVAADDAFLVLWSDGTNAYLSSMYVATDNAVWAGGELVGTNLAVITGTGALTAGEIHADNFEFIA